jgi:hypothetical protein
MVRGLVREGGNGRTVDRGGIAQEVIDAEQFPRSNALEALDWGGGPPRGDPTR